MKHSIWAVPVRTFFGSTPAGDAAMVNHAQTSIVKAAQPEEAPVLKLDTVGPANRAYLEQDGTGRLSLYFRGLRYGVDEYVPSSLFGSPISPSVTAGEFVCRQMLRRYGYHEDEWPSLARQFLMKHTTCQPDRSQHNR